jgi:hypothetical protein
MTLNKVLLMGMIAVMVGCTTSTQQLAEQGQWNAIGYKDGIKGVTARSEKALSALGAADINQYTEGYLRGNKEYCNADFAYQIGLSGQVYEGVCEGYPDGQKFRMEWQRGWNESK